MTCNTKIIIYSHGNVFCCHKNFQVGSISMRNITYYDAPDLILKSDIKGIFHLYEYVYDRKLIVYIEHH